MQAQSFSPPSLKWMHREKWLDKVSLAAIVFIMGWVAASSYYKVPNLWQQRKVQAEADWRACRSFLHYQEAHPNGDYP